MRIYNGTVSVRNRRLVITWTGEIARHVMEDYIEDDEIERLDHVEIQQSLAGSRVRHKLRNGKSWIAFKPDNLGNLTSVIFVISGKEAIIKTAYKQETIMENQMKKHGIGRSLDSSGKQSAMRKLRRLEESGDIESAEDVYQVAEDFVSGKLIAKNGKLVKNPKYKAQG